MFADLYKEGAITRDFATIDWANTNKEFYSGIAGIFIGTPRGMSQAYMDGLVKINPQAKFVHIDQFKAPDGYQGMSAGGGFAGFEVISAEAGKDKAKVRRILDMLEIGRTFFPDDKKNDKNADFDWLNGNVGTGYDMVNGKAVPKAGQESNTPIQYMLQRHEFWKPWAPSDDANQFSKASYNSPEMQAFIAKIEQMEKTYNKTPYDNPVNLVYSETLAAKGSELDKYLIDEQTKMISGQRPISDWDKMIEEWKGRGGAQLMKEVNDGIKEAKK